MNKFAENTGEMTFYLIKYISKFEYSNMSIL